MIKKLNNHSVSELLGAMLLLFIVIAVMSMIYLVVWNNLEPQEENFVTVSGKIEGNNIVLEHTGGETINTDTYTSFTIAGVKHSVYVKDYLVEENHNDVWDFGERLVYHFDYAPLYNADDLLAYDNVDIITVDEESNSIILMGPLELHPVSDIGVELFVDNETPGPNETVKITIVVTCYGGEVNGSANIIVKYLIPSGLEFIDYTADEGIYDPSTGFWNISFLSSERPLSIDINAKVIVEEISSPTQMGVILDGSLSIDGSDWQLMCNGLADSILNDTLFPDDETVELTVVQFGINLNSGHCLSSEEVSPININKTNKIAKAGQVRSITQGMGYTPMAAGIFRTSDILRNSLKFSPDVRKVILLITDGMPNCKLDESDYSGYDCGISSSDYTVGKSHTVQARDYLLSHLEMNEEIDEFDCFAVGTPGGEYPLDIEWLNESIAWPEPGYIGPPFDQGAGWVTHVNTWNEFSERLELVFKSFFSEISNQVVILDAYTTDLISSNDGAVLIIQPED